MQFNVSCTLNALNPQEAMRGRVVNVRLGVVLSRRGGALPMMLRPFRVGAGGPVGTGRQYMSWIAIDDADEATPYGRKFVIRATLVGPSGDSAALVSIWVVRAGEDFARFVTAYPEGER